jgi:PDZ domain-containing protein
VAGSGRRPNNIGAVTNAESTRTPRATNNVTDMTDPSVPVPPTDPDVDLVVDPDPAAPVRRRRRWPWFVGAVVVLVVIGIFTVPTRWYLFSPGSLRPTESAISIQGHTAFESKGSITYPTVSVSIRPATTAQLIRGLLDDRIEIESRDQIYGPTGNIQQDQIVNQQMMEDSKLAATIVAFRTVGYPVSVTGDGAFIQDVVKGFPASSTFHQGDVITSVEGHSVSTWDQLRLLMADRPAGSEVALTIRRPAKSSANQGTSTTTLPGTHTGADGTQTINTTVKLGSNPTDPSHGFLGVAGMTADQGLKLPFKIDMDSGDVTGPSGGLAWTLGLIDRLTPGDLTGGKTIVATGEMETDGTVGQIGGIEQKMAAVLRNGADEFFFPASTPKKDIKEIEDMAKGHDVQLHPVANISQALHLLAPNGLQKAPPIS